MEFDGKVALITGAGNGIGREVARAFSAKGAKVVLVDRDPKSGRAVLQELTQAGGQAMFVQADVTKSVEVKGYVEAALSAYGRLDCFFNNAGIEGGMAPIGDYDEEEFDRVIAVNLKGVFLGLKYVLPVMLKQGKGAVVNTASVAGIIGSPGMVPYTASKHAVIGITRVASSEVARRGVRVNAICPGSVETRMIHSIEAMVNPADPETARRNNAETTPSGRYTQPNEVAGLVLFLCSDIAANITGAQYVIDGGRSSTIGAFTR